MTLLASLGSCGVKQSVELVLVPLDHRRACFMAELVLLLDLMSRFLKCNSRKKTFLVVCFRMLCIVHLWLELPNKIAA